MISVTAQAGEADMTAMATAASCKNLKADLTIKSFQSDAVETLSSTSRAQTPRRRVQIRKGRSRRTIDDISDAVRIAISHRLLLISLAYAKVALNLFFPP
jgi:hypothetical protein